MSQAIDKELQNYWKLLDAAQKQSILGVIKSFLASAKRPAEINLTEYNNDIDEAMARMNAGKFTKHEDVEKQMKEW